MPAQRCNYETYVLKPLDSNPSSCAERNTHGRSLEDVKSLAEQWEEPPALFTLLDFGPMLGGEGGWGRCGKGVGWCVCGDGDRCGRRGLVQAAIAQGIGGQRQV